MPAANAKNAKTASKTKVIATKKVTRMPAKKAAAKTAVKKSKRTA